MLWVLSLIVVTVAVALIAVSCSSDDAPDCPTEDRCTVDGEWKVRGGAVSREVMFESLLRELIEVRRVRVLLEAQTSAQQRRRQLQASDYVSRPGVRLGVSITA